MPDGAPLLSWISSRATMSGVFRLSTMPAASRSNFAAGSPGARFSTLYVATASWSRACLAATVAVQVVVDIHAECGGSDRVATEGRPVDRTRRGAAQHVPDVGRRDLAVDRHDEQPAGRRLGVALDVGAATWRLQLVRLRRHVDLAELRLARSDDRTSLTVTSMPSWASQNSSAERSGSIGVIDSTLELSGPAAAGRSVPGRCRRDDERRRQHVARADDRDEGGVISVIEMLAVVASVSPAAAGRSPRPAR